MTSTIAINLQFGVYYRIIMKTKELYLRIKTAKHLSFRLNFPIDKMEDIAKNSNKLYYERTEAKKNGGVRKITPPKEPLKSLQKKIYENLLKNLYYPNYLNGAIKKRSIVTNAQNHVRKKYVSI